MENLWRKYSVFIIILIILIAGFVSYINVYENDFLWDDEFDIQRNEYITSFSYLPDAFTSFAGAGASRLDNFYRPIKTVLYIFVYSLNGLNPWWFHLVNVILHISSAVLIFFVFKKIFKKKTVAFLTALLWVVHPIHTEAVTYISATQDPLSVFFGLSSFFLYINFRENKKILYLFISIALFILALLSKESAIIFPGLFFLYEIVFNNGSRNWKQYYWVVPFFITSIIYFMLRLTVLNFGGTLNMYGAENLYTENVFFRIFTFLAALPEYYSFLIWPSRLHMEREFSVFTSFFSLQVFTSFIILSVLAFAVYKSFKKEKFYIAFGILWFFIAFFPMSGILIPVNSFLLEHWLYLPSIGFFFLAAVVIDKILEKFKYARNFIVAVLTVIIILMGMTLDRNKDWKDPITFYNNILEYSEGTARVHNNLAMAYAEEGEIYPAKEHYIKAIELSDTYPETHYNLARLYILTGEIDTAVEHLERSIEINSYFFYSYNLFGDIYQFKEDNEKAQEYYNKAKSIKYY